MTAEEIAKLEKALTHALRFLVEARDERDALRKAMQEIADKQVPGAFSRDQGEHAKNTLIATWEFAKAALAVQPCQHNHTVIDYYEKPAQGYVPQFKCTKCGKVIV